jgi:hypothetical protein
MDDLCGTASASVLPLTGRATNSLVRRSGRTDEPAVPAGVIDDETVRVSGPPGFAGLALDGRVVGEATGFPRGGAGGEGAGPQRNRSPPRASPPGRLIVGT